jgi:hypothetical protein
MHPGEQAIARRLIADANPLMGTDDDAERL